VLSDKRFRIKPVQNGSSRLIHFKASHKLVIAAKNSNGLMCNPGLVGYVGLSVDGPIIFRLKLNVMRYSWVTLHMRAPKLRVHPPMPA
jgi:hypothetical protein